ncbi:L-idonate 5-dehydrogenase [Frankia sp. Cppng1_Ct_nod]|uniref:L-idonate 5-dehydrogenase n=1 Tax=Frankia sp. Cppng1_Ct_nod TaxID=2897162 RepID=UPI001041959E|nr:L-idonate 5-dehydrogenase [Frankia sp. Cppng1_Ct_nod]
MRACVVHAAGDLRVEEVPDRAPGLGEVSVAVELAGICGSDLHYWRHGRVGDFRLREPLILGHEVIGTVVDVGPGVTALAVGTSVAVHPATPCGACAECRAERANVCRHSRYLGSAAQTPHVQGGFSDRLIVPARQVRRLPPGLAARRAVLAEPLSVAVHAAARAGNLAGRRVLITGAGPIGCLVVAAVAAAGAEEVVVTDLLPEALAIATEVGATATIPVDGTSASDRSDWPGDFDVAIEASGAAAALHTCVGQVRRGGTVVLLGLLPPGEVPLLGNIVVTRELTLRGAFRFDHEFDTALALLADGLPVGPVVSATLPLADAPSAFALAADRSRACKVLLDLVADR